MSTRPPLPPFTRDTAIQKVRLAEDSWNSVIRKKSLWRTRLILNDGPIKESDRKYYWPLGRRPDDHPGLSDLGF